MNKVILMGRLTRDPDVRYPQNEGGQAVARYTLAVDRRRRQNAKEGEQTADFISCVTFGKNAEFAEKYLRQGTKIVVTGRIITGSYTNKDGQKVYTTEVCVDEHEFAESKPQNGNGAPQGGYQQRPQNQGYAPQGGYQQPPQNNGYQQAPQQYQQPAPQQGGYQQPPQNQGYAPQGGYQQPANQMDPPDDFGFGSFGGDLPFN